MISLSHTVGYAIHALSYLRVCGEPARMIHEVAELAGIPQAYLAKIVARLASKQIVASKRGRKGGICLKRPAETITLLDIVVAIDGEQWISDCLLGLDDCHIRGVCPTKLEWNGVRDHIKHMLRQTTLADVIAHRHLTNPEQPVPEMCCTEPGATCPDL